jgi:hypothetical protein
LLQLLAELGDILRADWGKGCRHNSSHEIIYLSRVVGTAGGLRKCADHCPYSNANLVTWFRP